MKATDSDSLVTFNDVLRFRRTNNKYDTAYKYLFEDGRLKTITYNDLYQKSTAVAHSLLKTVNSGDRALLIFSSSTEFIEAFFGCLFAGIIAVPVYPPRKNQKMNRLISIAEDCSPSIILSTSSIAKNSKILLQQVPNLRTINWLNVDNVDMDESEFVQLGASSPHDTAFIQYTSGSTGQPKGVLVSHDNLINNSKIIYQAFNHIEGCNVVSWLPLFHDMGLIGGVLQPLYAGMTSTLMSPTTFIKRPIRWLQCISENTLVSSGGPNFGFEHCVDNIDDDDISGLDLSHWRVAFNGSEPVRNSTLERFANKFSSCGFKKEAFYPCYGMAEATLFISGGLTSTSPKIVKLDTVELSYNRAVVSQSSHSSKDFVSCGKPGHGHNLLIVDPKTKIPCSDDQIGEIWLSGASIAKGYLNMNDVSVEIFHAVAKNDSNNRYLRTGDLGFIYQDELFVTGRNKDLIIVRGKNYYPQDIELTVEESHVGLRGFSCVAFSVNMAQEEHLVIVAEVDRQFMRKLNYPDLVEKLRLEIAKQHGINPFSIVFLKPGRLPKTSSGKVQRNETKENFLNNALDPLYSWHDDEVEERKKNISRKFTKSQAGILHQKLLSSSVHERPTLIYSLLSEFVSIYFKIELVNIDHKTELATLGLDSLTAFQITNQLEQGLYIKIPQTILWDHTTLGELADYLLNEWSDMQVSKIILSQNVSTSVNNEDEIVELEI